MEEKSKKEEKIKKSNGNRLTPHQWGELLGLLKSGHYTQKQLAEMYGVSVPAIQKKRKKLDIKIGETAATSSSLDTIKKTKDAVETAMAFSIEESSALINDARRTAYKRYEMAGKIAEAHIAQALRDRNIEAVVPVIKVVNEWMTAIDKELSGKGKALGFKDGEYTTEDTLPTLVIQRMDEKEAKKIKSQSNSVEPIDMLVDQIGDEMDEVLV